MTPSAGRTTSSSHSSSGGGGGGSSAGGVGSSGVKLSVITSGIREPTNNGDEPYHKYYPYFSAFSPS